MTSDGLPWDTEEIENWRYKRGEKDYLISSETVCNVPVEHARAMVEALKNIADNSYATNSGADAAQAREVLDLIGVK